MLVTIDKLGTVVGDSVALCFVAVGLSGLRRGFEDSSDWIVCTALCHSIRLD